MKKESCDCFVFSVCSSLHRNNVNDTFRSIWMDRWSWNWILVRPSCIFDIPYLLIITKIYAHTLSISIDILQYYYFKNLKPLFIQYLQYPQLNTLYITQEPISILILHIQSTNPLSFHSNENSTQDQSTQTELISHRHYAFWSYLTIICVLKLFVKQHLN